MNIKLSIVFILLMFDVLNISGQLNVLIIGDSHGAAKNGWVAQLEQLRPHDTFCNLSIGGNTIGFKNLNRDTLNTLQNIRSYLQRGKNALGNIDRVLILLGTNDCKSVFKDSFLLSVSRFDSVIKIIRSEFLTSVQPEIVYITPPPFAVDSQLTEKYVGGNARLKILIPQLLKVAKKNQVRSIQLNKMLGVYTGKMTTDGVHYSADGYKKIAKMIDKHL